MLTVRKLFAGYLLVAACGSCAPPVTDDIKLTCPFPAALPFSTETRAPQTDATRTLLTSAPRSKDEASDTLGNPDGLEVTTYVAAAEMPAKGPTPYRGVKARTAQNDGLNANALGGEFVSLWFYDDQAGRWQSAGRTRTDVNGAYELPEPGALPLLGTPVYSVLEADGSCSEHYSYRLPTGTRVIVTDIDGTLTLSDNELLTQLGDGTYVPAMKIAADRLMQAWADKGYVIVYLTARPHMFRAETRAWLHDLGFPAGPVITADDISSDPSGYKAAWVDRLGKIFSWNIVAVYGNADTDIAAYEDAGIPKDRTFIIGPLAGDSGTTAIANDDYSSHIDNFVSTQPSAN